MRVQDRRAGLGARLLPFTTPAGPPVRDPYRFAVPAVLALAVAAFSGLWRSGALVLDGPGMSLYVRLALDHLLADGRIPYWVGELWAGTPVWAVVPSLPVFALVPLAAAVGPDVAVKIAVLACQVVGGWGVYVLARSLWGRMPAAVLAGLIYALHPVFVSHGALAGAETSAGVMAVTPWVAWSVGRGLHGDGTRYVVGAGLLSAVAVLHQPESAYPLAILAACMLAVEVGRVRGGQSGSTVAQVVARTGAAVAVSVGTVAYWLLPFLSLRDRFVLSPPELVERDLLAGTGESMARELGLFLRRSNGLAGTVSFDRPDLVPELSYLSWVCVALTLLTVAVLARGTGDASLTAILLASALAVWLSSGAVPLAESGAVLRDQVVPLVLAGAGAGLLLGAFLKRLHLGRAFPFALAAAAALLAVVPYLAPFERLQHAVPALAGLRFPRLFLLAPLGLALGAAYPVAVVERWARAGRAPLPPRLAPLGGTVAALAVTAAFLVDASPYASFYRLRPPPSGPAYASAARSLADEGSEGRVAVARLDPRAVSAVVEADGDLSVGWPHPVAGRELWRLAGEPFVSPPGYRDAAYALTATHHLVVERPVDPGTESEAVPEVALLPNPRVLPLARAYDRAVIVGDAGLAPVLATSLAHRNVAVVTGGGGAGSALGGRTMADVASPHPCRGLPPGLPAGVAGEVALACALDPWIGVLFAGHRLTGVEGGAGAVFPALAGDLQGVSVWLDRAPGRTELALHDVGADGRTLGPERARGQAVATDEYGLTTFTFDRIPGSAGSTFAFVLTCPGCPPDGTPGIVTGRALRGPGNVVVGDRLVTDRVAAFAPLYQRLAPAQPPATTIRSARRAAGEWRIESSGTAPSLVVVATSYFPGWRATVDGREAPVVVADGAFVGVPVDAGDHVVALEYRTPPAAAAGRLVTAATLLTIVVVGSRRRLRARGGGRGGAEGDTAAAPPSERPVEPVPGAGPDRPEVSEPVGSGAAVPDAAPVEDRPAEAEPAPLAAGEETGTQQEPFGPVPAAAGPDAVPVDQDPAEAGDEPGTPEEAVEPAGATAADTAAEEETGGGEGEAEVTVVELVEPTVPKTSAYRRRRRF